ncbi:MAG: bifunctional alpha,alpha-trehalose-phosphate synthase (UDP-forming)/trehalose-phosphatase [Desulfatitalea sp.]
MKTVINVSNRLPVTIGPEISRSSGGLVSSMENLGEKVDLKWIGWAGGYTPEPGERDRISRELIERFKYYPIFLDDAEATDYYDGFSNSTMWPLLHYMTTYSRYKTQWYEAYQRVNRIFAEVITKVVRPGDMVWVHDYHLMLLPRILREESPHLKIGFFLHTPFPPSEIFRCHPNREDLIQGLLGADLIGFQTFGFLRHFRATVLRVLGIESAMDRIDHDHYTTVLGAYPIGINVEKFARELHSTEYSRHLAEYRHVYSGKKVVLGVERLDYTKGIPRRLDAIEQFLDQCLNTEEIVFIFISVPSREGVAAYQRLVEQVQGRVSQINGKYSTIKNVPLLFMYQSVNFSQLCALYALADVCMVTPLVDGMNLVAKEYVFCQKEQTGVLILSEFAGAAQELPHALIVNPYHIRQMVDCLKLALEMPTAEKFQRMAQLRARVMRYDALHWAGAFLADLDECKAEQKIQADIQTISIKDMGALIESDPIALILDYDGTLMELRTKPTDAFPQAQMDHLFTQMAADEGLDVFLISGRTQEDMMHWFGRFDFALVAEHGFLYRLSRSEDWLLFDAKTDLGWMVKIIEIFNHYADMTPGSFVEVKRSSVVWHYRASEPEFGTWKAHQLVADLSEMLTNLPVKIHHGKKIVEVVSMQINKGMAMAALLARRHYAKTLCAGDDETDESMFRSSGEGILSVKVGDGATSARYRSPDPNAFRYLLEELLAERIRRKRERPTNR